MGIQYEVTAVTGKYTTSDGKEKSRYQKIGVVMQTKNGPMLKLESVPLAWDGWAYLNEPQEKPANKRDAVKPDDDIPF